MKLLRSLLAIAFCFGFINANSQCVPDSTITGLYSPTEAEGLPSGNLFSLYNAVIHMNIPAETTIVVTATIDSFIVSDITGLPVGIDYSCNPPSCNFPGPSFACIELNGTPTDTNDFGVNDLVMDFTLFTNITDVSDQITDYSIELGAYYEPNNVAKIDASNYKFYCDQNPAHQQSKLIYELPSRDMFSISIYSLLGAEVARVSQQSASTSGSVRIADLGLEAGVYFAVINQSSYTNTVRFILQ